jgi:hypothetical protein
VQAASEVLDDELRRVVEAVLAPRETRDTPARGTATPTVAATTTAPSTTATNAFAVAARSSADADCEAGRPLGTRQSPAIR